jgi:hypothetical protein
MQENNMMSVRRVTTSTRLIAAVIGLVVMPQPGMVRDAKGETHRVCPGFVVLANGYAVLSEENKAMQTSKGHDLSDHKMHKMADPGHERGGHQGHGAANHNHLMGYQHGQAIVAGKDELCVPIGSLDDTAWTAVSQTDGLSVAVESLRGPLAHNSRANEGFGITVIAPGGEPLDNADVQLFVHMPHHDHGMPGGHGAANDPDVKGLAMMPDEQGRYHVNTVDFSMPGPWLLQVVVSHGGETLKAYFAPNVGEE